MKDTFFGSLIGFILGFVFCLGLQHFLGVEPRGFQTAAQPIADARGAEYVYTVSDLERLVNPCIVNGPLPEECLPWVVNGEMTQPPIKIIIDTTPRNH